MSGRSKQEQDNQVIRSLIYLRFSFDEAHLVVGFSRVPLDPLQTTNQVQSRLITNQQIPSYQIVS